jgi:hypothetical protein
MATVAAVFFLASPIQASDAQTGTFAAGYAFGLNDGQSDLYGFNATAEIPFSDGQAANQFGLELLGGYHRPTDGDLDIWNLGTALYGRSERGRAAASFSYNRVGGLNVETIGLGGELFASSNLDLALRSGAVLWDGKNGGYIGGQGTWYLTPNIAFSGTVDYWSAGYNQLSETFAAEWMPSDTVPFSIYTGYQHWNTRGLSDSVIFVGARLYLSGTGQATLVERRHHDTNGFIARPPIADGQY